MDNKYKFSLLIACYIIGLYSIVWTVVHGIDYLKNSNLEQNEKLKIFNESINYSIKIIDKKIDSLVKEQNELKVIMQKQTNLVSFDEFKNELLNKITTITEKLLLVSKEQALVPVNKEISNQCQSVIKNFDSNKLQQVLTDIKSDNFYARQRAYKIMALIGSPEQNMVAQILLDKEEDISLRRELIETMDWNGFGSGLIALLQETGHPEIHTSVISKAEETQFTPNEKLQFENILSDKFIQEQDDESRKTVLKYFANTNKEFIGQLINNIDVNTLSPELVEYIQSIQQFPNNN